MFRHSRGGHFAFASCTRFSPNTRWPAAITGSIASAPKVFDTAINVTSAGSRPGIAAGSRDLCVERVRDLVDRCRSASHALPISHVSRTATSNEGPRTLLEGCRYRRCRPLLRARTDAATNRRRASSAVRLLRREPKFDLAVLDVKLTGPDRNRLGIAALLAAEGRAIHFDRHARRRRACQRSNPGRAAVLEKPYDAAILLNAARRRALTGANPHGLRLVPSDFSSESPARLTLRPLSCLFRAP